MIFVKIFVFTFILCYVYMLCLYYCLPLCICVVIKLHILICANVLSSAMLIHRSFQFSFKNTFVPCLLAKVTSTMKLIRCPFAERAFGRKTFLVVTLGVSFS